MEYVFRGQDHKVPTPLGSYNPDWAVLVDRDGHERLYFVVETKSSLFDEDLRDREGGKIKCGAAHFKALAVGKNPAVYGKFKDVDGLLTYERTTAPQMIPEPEADFGTYVFPDKMSATLRTLELRLKRITPTQQEKLIELIPEGIAESIVTELVSLELFYKGNQNQEELTQVFVEDHPRPADLRLTIRDDYAGGQSVNVIAMFGNREFRTVGSAHIRVNGLLELNVENYWALLPAEESSQANLADSFTSTVVCFGVKNNDAQ